MLRSVGVLANRANSLIEYWIYLLKEGYSDPEDGELIYSAVGENGIKAKYAGYNVQDLLKPIALVKDQLFSIVARVFGSEGGQLPLEAESNMSDSPYVKKGRGANLLYRRKRELGRCMRFRARSGALCSKNT